MNYQKENIKNGITLHLVNTNKFKTNLLSIFLTTPVTRENVTYNALLAAILRRGTMKIKTQEELSQKLEGMYGASLDTGIDKIGDNHILKFYIETINDDFLPQGNEKMLKESIGTLTDIVFNPLIENEAFNEEYLSQEKENIKQHINAKVDNKALYAKQRCIEEMYKNEPAGLFKYGYIEDLEKIDSKNLYKYYQKLLKECKIDIFVSGEIDEEKVKNIIKKNEEIRSLSDREAIYVVNSIETKKEVEEKKVIEQMDVTQGKIVIGTDIIFDEKDIVNKNIMYEVIVYNNILGGSASSKMFKNVREKESLAYTASSNYAKYKSNIFIMAGIEIANYEKALNIIRKQIEDMAIGDFSDDDLANSKKVIISGIDSIDDEQDTELMYLYGQELLGTNESFSSYIKKINNVTKEQVIDVAKKIKINTIYFLRNKEEENANN